MIDRGGAVQGRPVRVAVLDAQPGRFEQNTRRVLLRAGVERVLELTARDPRRFGERAQALRDARPDVVLVPAADRSGADALAYLAEPLRYGCASQQPAPLVIVASSDDGAIARATVLLSLFRHEVAPDVRTDAGRTRVAARLRELRRDVGILRDDALEELAVRAATGRTDAAVVLDVSGSSTSILRAEPGGKLVALHARPLGVGAAADRLVARGGLERVRRWIPWSVDEPTLLERVFNRARWPDAVSVDRESHAVEVALAREAVAHALVDAHAAGIGSALRPAGLALLVGRLAGLDTSQAEEIATDVLGVPSAAEVRQDTSDRLLTSAVDAISRADHSQLDIALRNDAAVSAAAGRP